MQYREAHTEIHVEAHTQIHTEAHTEENMKAQKQKKTIVIVFLTLQNI